MTRRPADVSVLDTALVVRNARLLAAALEVDPAYRYLMPHAATRLDGLAEFFVGNQRMHLPARCTHVARDEHGALLGTVTVRPPGGIRVSTLTMLRSGIAQFAWRHGRAAVRRLMWLRDTYERLEVEAARGAAHFHVHMMAVEPAHQGRGHGTLLLQRVLDVAMCAQPAIPAVLTTHFPQNLVFYRRSGFEVVDERELHPPGGEPYTVWSMSRDG